MAGLSSFPGRAVFQQRVQDSVQTAGIVIVLIVARVYSTGFRLTMKEWPARIAVRRAVDGSVQLLYKTDLSAEEFISTQAWHDAKLSCCPMHPDGGCRFARHGSYGRKTPSGLRIARYYCPDSSMTFSLLPQFMAAGMAGTLQSVEDSVAAFEADGSLASAAERASGAFASPATGAWCSASRKARPWTWTCSTITDRRGVLTMNDIASERVGPMRNPPHLGELIRESMDDAGWNVTETAARLGCERGTLSRLLNGKAGVSANMALALEDIGWGTAEHWMRMQASYELARARSDRTASDRRVRALHP